jgi:hypothetical protein
VAVIAATAPRPPASRDHIVKEVTFASSPVPASPPRASRRPLPTPIIIPKSSFNIKSESGLPFPIAPTSLPPPPRPLTPSKMAIKRPTPPPSPSPYGPVSDEARRRYSERYLGKAQPTVAVSVNPADPRSAVVVKSEETSGLAGVGAGGRSRPTSIRSRPNSFYGKPAEDVVVSPESTTPTVGRQISISA